MDIVTYFMCRLCLRVHGMLLWKFIPTLVSQFNQVSLLFPDFSIIALYVACCNYLWAEASVWRPCLMGLLLQLELRRVGLCWSCSIQECAELPMYTNSTFTLHTLVIICYVQLDSLFTPALRPPRCVHGIAFMTWAVGHNIIDLISPW